MTGDSDTVEFVVGSLFQGLTKIRTGIKSPWKSSLPSGPSMGLWLPGLSALKCPDFVSLFHKISKFCFYLQLLKGRRV